jgi:hypothetical protein
VDGKTTDQAAAETGDGFPKPVRLTLLSHGSG